MSRSKLQKYVSEQISLHLGGYAVRENYRPRWLETGNGQCLELDFYIDILHLAIEVQGQQHYEYVPYFHKSYQDFLDQKSRDIAKKIICERRGIALYYIHDETSIDTLIEALTKPIHDDRPITIKEHWQVVLDRAMTKVYAKQKNDRSARLLRGIVGRVGANAVMEYNHEYMPMIIEYLKQDEQEAKLRALQKDDRYFPRWRSKVRQRFGLKVNRQDFDNYRSGKLILDWHTKRVVGELMQEQ